MVEICIKCKDFVTAPDFFMLVLKNAADSGIIKYIYLFQECSYEEVDRRYAGQKINI